MTTAQKAVIVGAAETTGLGKLPTMSTLDLNIDAAVNALNDAGLAPADIDGLASTGAEPIAVARSLGIEADYVDASMMYGASSLFHLRHALAAVENGLCSTVLITHGESGRSRVAPMPFAVGPQSDEAQFETPYGPIGPPGTFSLGVVRYMRDFGLTPEQLASVAVVQRRWAADNPRAMMKDPLSVEDVLASPLLAYPIHLLECCLVADGGGAIVVTSAERAADLDLPHGPVSVLGSAETVENPMISMMDDFTTSRGFRSTGRRSFAEAGITHGDVDHLMIYDAFAFLPIYGLEDLGFVGRGEAGSFLESGATAPGGTLPLNTNGGGLSYVHTGMYGMFALQESIRQLRGTAAAQVDDVEISVAHAVGGYFRSMATAVLAKT